MRKKDTTDVLLSVAAVAADAAAVFGGFLAATWLRFDSGLFRLPLGRPAHLYETYAAGGAVATLLFLFVFQALGLYVRPQTGRFEGKIPRLARACGIATLLSVVVAFAVKNEAEFSSLTIGLSFATGLLLAGLERYLLYRVEWNLARHSRVRHRVLVLGTNAVAARIRHTLEREAMLRSRVFAFLRTDDSPPAPGIPPDAIRGSLADLPDFVRREPVDQIVLANAGIGTDRMMDIVLLCERHLIAFNVVPDLFHVLTSSMDVQSLDDIPLLGLGRWPLDHFWNRALKRACDVVGAACGAIALAPAIALAAIAVKLTSPGPVFYHQERCGEKGRAFRLHKLRTMRADAEAGTGPVFASEDDPRRTRLGGFLRRYNLDELPQLWNVLRGEMSLVGPRPERPHFVEQFKEEISRYMWRHVSKPGMTGWAQVNGLRGNTSIEERVKYDLYYLEHWSPAFDLKILLRTLFARENAY
jgi:exopolysaccharide biosynthesis polyprenyl glycosylphosphotransferase